jgi:hypothetical protein
MPNVSILLLSNYQIDITKEYSFRDLKIAKFEEDVRAIFDKDPDTTLLVCEIIERTQFTSEEQNALDRIFEVLNRVAPKYYLVVDDTMGHQVTFNGNVAYLSGCMMLAYLSIWMKGHPVATEWNPKTNQGLMLLGKCQKIHRIGLLKKFYEQNVLDSIEWTAHFINQRNLIKEQFFKDYTDDEYDMFVTRCNRLLDLSNDHPCLPKVTDGYFHHQGFPFDHTLYERTAFSIILESEYYGVGAPWLSEKTWRAIANKHPFIMVGGESNIPDLKSRGYRTFEELMHIPEYYSLLTTVKNVDHALNSIVTNTVEFSKLLENASPSLIAKINEDVEHNYKLFEDFMGNQVAKFLETTNLTTDAIVQLIDIQLSPWCK